jgi:RNA polymerase sigma-70 factor (ECF subfamily)
MWKLWLVDGSLTTITYLPAFRLFTGFPPCVTPILNESLTNAFNVGVAAPALPAATAAAVTTAAIVQMRFNTCSFTRIVLQTPCESRVAATRRNPGAKRDILDVGIDPIDFRAFYVEALPRVYGYLVRRCASAAIAEELTQETFLAAVVALRKGARPDEPLAWVLGIARHKLVDDYRRTQREAPVGDEAAVVEVSSDGRGIAALSAVPRDQRIALVLRHVDGMSVPEVASALGRSVEAAESLLARGRAAFRAAYSEVTT